jgi:N4-gp56 family major capsid protein
MATRNIPNYTAVADIAELIPEIWAAKVYEEQYTTTLFEKFHGPEGSDSAVIRKMELMTGPGNTIHISRINDLTGAGGTGEGQARGNDEKLVDATVSVVPSKIWHLVSWDWISNKQSISELRPLVLRKLTRWWNKKIDTIAWTAATQTVAGGFDASAIDRTFAGDALTVDGLDESDTFGPDVIDTMIAKLRLNDVPPMVVEGQRFYPILVHTNQARDLREDSTYRQAQREANVRGSDNPIFTGALGKWNEAMVYESTNCPTATNANSPAIKYAVAVALGAEALCVGACSNITWAEEYDAIEGWYQVIVRQYLKYEILNHKNIMQVATAAIDP